MRVLPGYRRMVMVPLLLAGTSIFSRAGSTWAGDPLSCTSGNCEACHARRQFITDSVDSDRRNLMLRGSDPSSTCLICHETAYIQPQGAFNSTSRALLRAGLPPLQLTPAGDYGWLRKNYTWQGENGRLQRSPGERHGHNIVGVDFDLTADTTLRLAPGGFYPANGLSCISCHDPHGSYRRSADGTISSAGLPIIGSGSYTNSPDPNALGSVRSYRMLAGKGYQPKSLPFSIPFSADPPAAVAPVAYNRAETSSDTRVAYGSGMSEWCGNCHGRMHDDGAQGLGHPVGNGAKLSARTVLLYNSYIESGDFRGTAENSYTSLVPFEMGTSNYAALKRVANSDGSNLGGPGMEKDAPNVMCLSCHRAHASGWDSITRWNMKSTFIVYNGRYPGIDNGAPAEFAQGRTEGEVMKTFYGRPASRYADRQRSLCNKCHGRD